jgi:hypothetical protein
MESLVPMIAVAISATAALIDAATARLKSSTRWPDPVSAFAYRMFSASELPPPGFASFAIAAPNSSALRITPEIAGYGYLFDQLDADGQKVWRDAIDHLRGREIYPPDRQTFAFNPVEILGVATGLSRLHSDDGRRSWLVDAIRRGFAGGHFRTPMSAFGAQVALVILAPDALKHIPDNPIDYPALSTTELLLAAGIDLAFRILAPQQRDALENEFLSRTLTREVAVNDAAEAAAVYILALRIRDRTLAPKALIDDLEKVLILCRRFPLLSDTLRTRYNNRPAFEITDEYDVQDLLHGILRLHFDDIRPEEYAPSYAGKHSRVDFHLPRERMVVEAKMTRKGLGQKEVIDQLLIDVGRYSKMAHVDTLICLVFDPERKCINPKGIEADVEDSGGRLVVRVVVCPQCI